MMLGVLLGAGILLAWAAGADLRRLGEVRFRHGWLIAVAFALQLAVFAIPWTAHALAGATVTVHVVSYGLLLGFAAANLRQPGFVVAALGLASNTLAIFLNHGRMPVALSVWRSTGRASGAITETGHYNNNVLASAHTHLAFLGDVLPLPAAVPLANAFSVGDLLLLVGAIVFVRRRCTRMPATDSADAPRLPWQTRHTRLGASFRERGNTAGMERPAPLTVSEVADQLGCSEDHVRTLIRDGELETVACGVRPGLVPRHRLDDYLRRLRRRLEESAGSSATP